MARMRTIKPEFFSNEDLAVMDPLACLLFAGLWCWADRAGRLEDRPGRLKLAIMPARDCDVDALLDVLAARGFVVRYAIDGARFIQVVNFLKHQNPHKKERPSTIPPPAESVPTMHAVVRMPAMERSSTVQAPDENGALPVLEPEEHHTSRAGHGPWGVGCGVPAMEPASEPAEPHEETVDAGVSLSAGAPAGARKRESTHPARAEARARRALIGALEEVERFGPPANSVESKRRGAAADALLASSPPVTPAEVPLLVERWDQDHDPAFCTPMALAGNLTQLRAPPANPIGRRRGAPFRPGAWDRPPVGGASRAPPGREWHELNADRRPSEQLRDVAEGLA